MSVTRNTGSSRTCQSWRPILSGEDRTKALQVIADIANATEALVRPVPVTANPTPEPIEPGLARGDAGLAVLFSYAQRCLPDRCADTTAARLLESSFDKASELPLSYGLMSGFTGIAWAISHLESGHNPDVRESLSDVDALLVQTLHHAPWPGEYDLIGGLVGIGIYAAERLPDPQGREILTLVVERLAETAERTEDGVTWATPPFRLNERRREISLSGWYNLGVAHGVPGVIALLAWVYAANIAPDTAGPLLHGAVTWLLRQRQDPSATSWFSYDIGPSEPATESRLAWCYGDLGIALALWSAGRSTGMSSWEDAAVEIARHAAGRPFERSEVVDASLCHGAAGAAHLFNRMYHYTNDALFRDTAIAWYRNTFELRRPGAGIAGYQFWFGFPTPEWRSVPGFLEGSAGTALALLSACTPVAPDWDRSLLVSNPFITSLEG
jgi:hypothetical protein